jgi:hypothetical protein
MNPFEQLLKRIEGLQQNMEHFVEHMEVILNNVEDNLTKELLSHLVEEEEERAISVNELIQTLREWQFDGGTSSTPSIGPGFEDGMAPSEVTGSQLNRGRSLTVGSMIQY